MLAALAAFETSVNTDEERACVIKFKQAYMKIVDVRDHEAFPASRAGQKEQASNILEFKIAPLTTELSGYEDGLKKWQLQQAREAIQTVDHLYSQTFLWLLLLGLAAVGLSLVLGIALERSINEPLQEFEHVFEAIVAGDLTVRSRLNTRDEFGSMASKLNVMNAHLHKTLGVVQESVARIASGAQQLAASAEQMSASTNEIARMTESQKMGSEGMAAAITELSASISEVASSAHETQKKLAEAEQAAQSGVTAGGGYQFGHGRYHPNCRGHLQGRHGDPGNRPSDESPES